MNARRVVSGLGGLGFTMAGFLVSASCGGRSGADTASVSDGATGDGAAMGRCDISAPFGTPVPIPGFDAYLAAGGLPPISLSEDELDALVFSDDKVVELIRASTDAPFGNPIEHPELDFTTMGFTVFVMSLSFDGHAVVFGGIGGRGSDATGQTAVATRTTRGQPFALAPIHRWQGGPVWGVSFVATTEQAFYATQGRANASALFRESPTRGRQRVDVPAAARALRLGINRDETDLLLQADSNLRVTRANADQAWNAPTAVAELSSPDMLMGLSPDGCRAYLLRLGSATHNELLVTQRGSPTTPAAPPPGPDGVVDAGMDSGIDGGVGDCPTFVDHTNDANVQLTWDLTVESNPARCSMIKAGSTVTWVGNFANHPLEARGGDTPNPIPLPPIVDVDGGFMSTTIAFPNAGTFGYDCQNHPARMFGAIKVVP